MEATTAHRPGGRLIRPVYSCIRCSDRKVKCDRQNPCGSCTKHDVKCEFRPLNARKPTKRARDDNPLRERMKRYEQLLKEQGIDPNVLPTPESLPRDEETPDPASRTENSTSRTPEQEPQMIDSRLNEAAVDLRTPDSVGSEMVRITKTQLLQQGGLARFVDNPLWTRVIEEMHDPEEAFNENCQGSSDEDSHEYHDGSDFVLGVKSDVKCVHPPSDHIHYLWQAFVENVDPLTKIVHVPTLRPAIRKATISMESVPKSFEALMFAIYSMAVLSLQDTECMARLGEPRKVLLSRYILATKVALARTNLMGTLSLVVLQALILHIFSIRDIYDPRTVWTLTGVALRIAEGMGLQRDGASFSLPPFEAEIRRRIWWQLKMHDLRTTDLTGLAKSKVLDRDEENTTQPPININDDQLYPGMASLPEESNTPTDMVFVGLRSQLSSFAMNLHAKKKEQGVKSSWWNDAASASDVAEKEAGLKEVEDLFETKYLRYCDPSDSLQLMAMLFARMGMNHARFLVHHPRRWPKPEMMPESERQLVWSLSVKLLEQTDLTLSSRQLQRFWWNGPYFFPWPAFIHIIDTLRANPLIPEAQKTWRLIESIYASNGHLLSNTNKPIYIVVGNLTLKAYDAHLTALSDAGVSAPAVPEFITKLQQQRASAKAKREARNAKKNQTVLSSAQAQTSEYMPKAEDAMRSVQDSSAEYMPLQDLNTQSNPLQPNIDMETDPFWFTNGFVNDSMNAANGFPNDIDTMLACPTTSLDNIFTGDHMDWQQWDATLANLNMSTYH